MMSMCVYSRSAGGRSPRRGRGGQGATRASGGSARYAAAPSGGMGMGWDAGLWLVLRGGKWTDGGDTDPKCGQSTVTSIGHPAQTESHVDPTRYMHLHISYLEQLHRVINRVGRQQQPLLSHVLPHVLCCLRPVPVLCVFICLKQIRACGLYYTYVHIWMDV